MAVNPWKAPAEIEALVNQVRQKYHSERLAGASLAICLDDSKPFVRNKLNLGKISKFNPLAKLWLSQKYDFCLSIPSELWHSVLKNDEREAYLDLQLTRCGVEYIPEEAEDEDGKMKVVKDEWGRIKYTNKPKTDDEGEPKWKVLPVDLEVLASNVRRYGLWYDGLSDLKDAIIAAPTGGIDAT